MRRNWLKAGGEGAARWLAAAREWLRRVMPRVAVAAAALFVLLLFVGDTALYRDTPLGVLGVVTFLAVSATLLYYGLKILVRLKRLLLWRVRRRLVITYLFVGLTPIVLLLLLGYLAARTASSQALARVVAVQHNVTELQAQQGASAMADALLAAANRGGEGSPELVFDKHAEALRAVLPGARVRAWRGGAGEDAGRLGEGGAAQYVSERVDEATRAVGMDKADARESLPAWLSGHHEWGGLAYLPPPEESKTAYGTPYVRALARRADAGRSFAVLVTVPISRALVERYRRNTGLHVRPFFIGVQSVTGGRPGASYTIKDDDEAKEGGGKDAAVVKGRGPLKEVDFGRDQFGDPIPNSPLAEFWYPVFLQSTDWTTGERGSKWAFMVDWSWPVVWQQFWGDAQLGEAGWWLLVYTGAAFLVLELLALFSAAWMTRAVTGTVHKLYRATEFIKRGDFSHRIRTRSRDQLGELALAFNDMSANIEVLLAERVERERLEREVEIAAEVQAQLFPRNVPWLAGAELAGECRAARGVAGDYYDYVEVAPGLVALALGDVSGKGISASLVMSNLQAALRAQATIIAERVRLAERQAQAATGGSNASAGAQALDHRGEPRAAFEHGRPVAAMTASINAQLCRSTDSNRFATLFLALYDDGARCLRYTNAGHNSPLLVRADGSVERLSTGGTIVGTFDFVQFDEAEVTLRAGDLLVIYSDGLSEAQNSLGEEYGEERLAALATARRHDTPDNIRQSIFDEVDKWTGDAERNDDQTIVILKAVKSSPESGV